MLKTAYDELSLLLDTCNIIENYSKLSIEIEGSSFQERIKILDTLAISSNAKALRFQWVANAYNSPDLTFRSTEYSSIDEKRKSILRYLNDTIQPIKKRIISPYRNSVIYKYLISTKRKEVDSIYILLAQGKKYTSKKKKEMTLTVCDGTYTLIFGSAVYTLHADYIVKAVILKLLF